MSGPREAVVNQLVSVMLDSMLMVKQDYSGDEMLSACMTLARRAIVTILEMRPEARPVIQGAIESMLLDCADIGSKAN